MDEKPKKVWTPSGLYRYRDVVCAAPNCETVFKTNKIDARYCSNRCRTAFGRWSFPANCANRAVS